MKPLLRFMTCGSVDDGKSTLIGHMLYAAKLIYADQEKALELDSKVGSRGGKIDYSLLLDGLTAEREQGITIDVAYRYFTSDHRSFIAADTPGHEEYTRNMAVGASHSDLAVLLVDASKGVQSQTKRHLRICSLMGIKHIAAAVNKMDLLAYDKEQWCVIESELNHMAKEFELKTFQVIPVSAAEGDNILDWSKNMPWYSGPALLPYLEQVEIDTEEFEQPFYMPVQRVSRPNQHYRGYQGQIEGGMLRVGDTIYSLPSREKAIVKSLKSAGRETTELKNGMAASIELDRNVDVSRGCVLTTDKLLPVTSKLKVDIIWMDEKPLIPGRNYMMKIGTQQAPASVVKIYHQTDINSGELQPAVEGRKNEVITCDIALSSSVAADRFSLRKEVGSFILIDRLSGMTAGAGVVQEPKTSSADITWHETSVTHEHRAALKGQNPAVIWLTGLSGSGKSSVANRLEEMLHAAGRHSMLLDGDNVRHGLNRDLHFTEADRAENIRRIAETAKLMCDAGLITIVSFISPFREDREQARAIIGESRFREVYISTPLHICEQRDPKGLYVKARQGEIEAFTGVTSPYEAPESPDLTIDTSSMTIQDAAELIYTDIDQIQRSEGKANDK
ncbi:adenylyl-sulfate kinase [Alkalicoccus luteus]|uniref:adenylyl-sulfate kinase n=1 Tax=Alkalicoccus luteus TaxID=1237094 RepID=UPI0040339979